MTEKLTPEFLAQNNVVFYPKTTREAEKMVEFAIQNGYVWGGDGSTSTDASLFKCVKDGLVIKHDKKIYTKPSLNYPYIVFQASDIPGIKPEDLLTDHDVLLRELAAQRAEITDLRQKLDRVLELLEPQVIEKPRLKFP